MPSKEWFDVPCYWENGNLHFPGIRLVCTNAMTADLPDFGRPGDSRNPILIRPMAYDSSLETGMLPLFKAEREALARVIDYCWEREREDFRREPISRHIFHDLVLLHNRITGSRLTPEQHLEALEK